MSVQVKVKKNLSIPSIPKVIFVVELDRHLLITGFPINECVFPLYRFDTLSAYDDAFKVAEDIAIKTSKLIANAIDFNLDDPHVYDPIKMHEQMKNLMQVIATERLKIQSAHSAAK